MRAFALIRTLSNGRRTYMHAIPTPPVFTATTGIHRVESPQFDEATRWEDKAGWRVLATVTLPLDRQICFHPGTLHGGVTALLLDEAFGLCCPHGVTASLRLKYKQPVVPRACLITEVWTTKIEGRKTWMEGIIKHPDANTGKLTVAVEGESLFIRPKETVQA